jgi:hypothetical protein
MVTLNSDSDSLSTALCPSHTDMTEADVGHGELSTDDTCKMFSNFLVAFDSMEKSGQTTTETFLNAVERIADAVLTIEPRKLLEPILLAHPLMSFLQQILIDILNNWRASDFRLNIQETDIFLKIVTIFMNAVEESPITDRDQDRQRIKDLLATRTLLYVIRTQIHDNIRHKVGINDDPNICTLGLLTIILLQGCPFYHTSTSNAKLLDHRMFFTYV